MRKILYSDTPKSFTFQLQKYIKMILHHYQGGFVPEVFGSFNIQKSITVIHHINRIRKNAYS